MTALIILVSLIFLGLIVFQISRVRELTAAMRGEAEAERKATDRNGVGMLVFMVLFLAGTLVSAFYYRNYILGYGPWASASEHGGSIDTMINTTLIITGIAFLVTNFVLAYFAWKYRSTVRKRADFISHDNKLEVVWTLIPAIVMTALVIGGLDAWNDVMADVPELNSEGQPMRPGVDYLEIEATGYQFGWDVRYPGADGYIGTKDFRLIDALNPVGQDWTDYKNHDDFMPSELVLPVGKTIRVRITSKDVLHNFYLPHFTVKMDAVPGMPTYFVFTPTITTDSMRQRLKDYPEFQGPARADEPDGPTKAEAFNYELACAELCGKGHWSMRKPMRVVSEAEYNEWAAEQQSWYLSTIRGTDDDPFQGQLVPVEVDQLQAAMTTAFETAYVGRDSTERSGAIEGISVDAATGRLSDLSTPSLERLAELLGEYPNTRMQINVEYPTNEDRTLAGSDLGITDYLTSNGVSPTRFSVIRDYPLADADEVTPEAEPVVTFTLLPQADL